MRVWTILGLKRTDDIAEIRRAYSRKLKAIDVEADPSAFIALREAFERARADAEARRWREETDSAQDDAPLELPTDAPLPADPMPAPAPAPEPETAAREDPDARFTELERLLFPGDGAPPPDPEALADAVGAILAHPEMDQVDRRANVELWLAELLFDAAPRSDPVVATVVDHFHWDAKAGDWDQLWSFEALVNRRNALALIDQLADENHHLHWAWCDLTGNSPTLGLERIGRGGDISLLLQKIRDEAPPAEEYLNPDRVALWEAQLNKSVPNILRWAIVAFWILFLVVRFGGLFDGH